MTAWRKWRKSARPKFVPSRPLVEAAYRLLMVDKAMIGLLLAGGFAAAAAFGVVMFPAWYFGHITPSVSVGGGVAGVLVFAAAMWAASFVNQLVTGAVVAAAMLRADGGDPSVRAALAVTWSRRRQLAAWALVSTVVGLLLSRLERLGVAGGVARLVAGAGWATATIFAVPLVISEGTMPAATLRRSAALVRQYLGVTVRSEVRMAAPWVAAGVAAAVVAGSGALVLAAGVDGGGGAAMLIGGALAAAGGTAFFFTVVTSAALTAYLDTLLFRYATGRPVPGVSPADLPPLHVTA